MIDYESTVAIKLIEIAVENCVKKIKEFYPKLQEGFKDNLSHSIKSNLNKTYAFSEEVTLFRRADNKKILSNSIPLDISNQTRLFKTDENERKLSEDELINTPDSILIIGDVGAGKTTTLKRIIQKVLIDIFGENKYNLSLPLFFRFSEIGSTECLCTFICAELGLKYEVHERKESYTKKVRKTVEIDLDENDQPIYGTETHEENAVRIIYEKKIGDHKIEHGVAEYLDSLNCVIFLDGLDEVNDSVYEAVQIQIKELSNLLIHSKLFITSRHLENIGTFKKFKQFELCSLEENQKKTISSFYLNNPDTFFDQLQNVPYFDLSNRPLFLIYILLVYLEDNNQLPERANDIYESIIQLVIRDWDLDKEIEIKRYTKYRKFNNTKKLKFLSNLAFELAYKFGAKKQFNKKLLEKVYLNIYSKYSGLKSEDKISVIKDIESHNGLIVEIKTNTFQFSHSSLHEYLCARYIETLPFSNEYYKYFNIYSVPFSIATVMSPEPSDFFSLLFLGNINLIRVSHQLKEDRVYEYLDRLIQEKFSIDAPNEELGLAILHIKSKYNFSISIKNILVVLGQIKYINESISSALKYYTKKSDKYVLNRRINTDLPLRLEDELSF